MTNPLSLRGAVGVGEGGQTSAGTTQATAAVLISDHVHVPSVASGSGVILNPANGGEMFSVGNGDASNALLVYPPVGASFNGAAANASLSLPAQGGAFFIFATPTKITAIF